MKIRNILSIKKLAVLGICVSFLAGGCGKMTESSIPKLEEPVALNEAYRPVEYAAIGSVQVLMATAVPRDYCNYYSANVNISQIYVEPGDTVNAGDVLAVCDVDEAKKQLQECKAALAHENETYEISAQISDTQIRLWESQAAGQDNNEPDQSDGTADDTHEADADTNIDEYAAVTGEFSTEQTEKNESTDEDYNTQIATEQENQRYDKQLHEYRVQKINEQMALYQQIVDDGMLKAAHSGLVTYTKKLTEGRSAAAYENIVIVSDTDDLVLDIKDTAINEYKYSDYDKKYVIVDGEKYDVTESQYTSEVLVLSKINNRYSDVCVESREKPSLTAGQMYPVYFEKTKANQALVVGKDSIYKDGDTRYVYVKNDEGGREKRIITTGESDENYTQVTEGLKEGELVYYNSTDQVPTKYSKYTVTRSDFDIANYGVQYSRSDAGTITETCDYEGQIVSVNVKQDDMIEKGMLLYVVDTGEGKAAITEAKNAIDSENESYAQKIADYDKQIKDLSEGGSSAEENNRQDEKPDTADDEQQLKLNLQLLDLQKKLAGADHTYQLSRLQSAYDSISAGNDGKGNISVYAKNDGKVSKVSVKAGDNVEEGADILQITGNSTDVLLVQVKDSNSYKVCTDNIADVGERVSLELDGTTIYGSCIGFAGYGRQAQKGYVNQDDKGVHITGNTDSGYGNAAFYIKLDNGIPDDLTRASAVKFSYVSFKKVVVVPTSIIHKQVNPMDKDDISYYVWKIDGDSVVKQPVILSDYTSGSNTLVLYGIDEGDEICLAS
nr:biotin/lipoyl-binding protein [uncultured Agathobacter sp.]